MLGIIRTVINIIFGFIEVILTLRLVFKFFVIGAESEFITWLYTITAQFVAPFVGIIPNWNIGGLVIEFSTLIALAIYSLVGYFLLQLFSYTSNRYYSD